jgi:hypothetical protein
MCMRRTLLIPHPVTQTDKLPSQQSFDSCAICNSGASLLLDSVLSFPLSGLMIMLSMTRCILQFFYTCLEGSPFLVPEIIDFFCDCHFLHNEELHSLHSSPNIITIIKSRKMRWAGHVARMGETRNAYGISVGKPEGKRPLGRPTRRWVDNIKIYILER